MSQGDYIRYKRVSQELKRQSKLPAVFDSGNYTNYKEYSVENTVVNDLTQYDRVIPSTTRIVFGMERPQAMACPAFEVCRNTDKRGNRVLHVYSALNTIPPNDAGKKKFGQLVFENMHCRCVK
jgi:hypothetical protein